MKQAFTPVPSPSQCFERWVVCKYAHNKRVVRIKTRIPRSNCEWSVTGSNVSLCAPNEFGMHTHHCIDAYNLTIHSKFVHRPTYSLPRRIGLGSSSSEKMRTKVSSRAPCGEHIGNFVHYRLNKHFTAARSRRTLIQERRSSFDESRISGIKCTRIVQFDTFTQSSNHTNQPLEPDMGQYTRMYTIFSAYIHAHCLGP